MGRQESPARSLKGSSRFKSPAKKDDETSLEDQVYYHGVLPRDEINNLLQNDGDFIVRKTRKNGVEEYVLSAFWKGPKHFIFNKDKNDKWCLEGPAFDDIPELIDFYHKHGRKLTAASHCVLVKPVKRERWQLDNEDIHKEELLGKGHFGEVWRGYWVTSKGRLPVAIKTCHEKIAETDKAQFIAEAKIMRSYVHPNIVRFIGVAAQSDPMMLVMELVPNGSLKSHLKENKGEVTTKEMIGFALDAAKGMEYLEANKCIHRDLATRNCLLDKNWHVKISDFGMSREELVYKTTQNRQIPVKWTAPEALQFGIYTSKSDVWSFGVLLWEIFSCGEHPYPRKNNKEAVAFIKKGGRMDPPPKTPKGIVELMDACWIEEHPGRPSFAEIRKKLDAM